MISRTLPLALLLGLLALAAPASAQEPVTSANVKYLGNVPYPLKWEKTDASGTDLEFATITVASAAASITAPAPAPAKPAKVVRRKKQTYAQCARKAKRIKNKRKRAAAQKKCRKLRKTAKRSMADVDPATPGVQRKFMFAGSYENGLQIFDVSEPATPKLVQSYDCGITQGDVQVFHRADLGRWLLTFTSDGTVAQPDSACALEAAAKGYDPTVGGGGSFIIDVTNPEQPSTVSFVPFAKGSHNMTVHPSGKYLYNSNSDLATDVSPAIEVADITDPKAPKEIATLPITPLPGLGSNSHDIWFNADGTRAYSAAVSQTLVIDTTDPAAPEIISTTFDPSVNVSHQAETFEAEVPGLGKRTVMAIADEFAGAVPTGQCPNGGLHFYDVSPDVEAAPVKLGYFNQSDVRATDDLGGCTAHVFQIDRATNLMHIAWYNGGFRTLDLNAVLGLGLGEQGTGVVEVASGRISGGSAWSAKSPDTSRDKPFHVYANDMVHGLDTFEVNLAGGGGERRTGTFYLPGKEPQLAGGRGGISFVCQLGMKG